MKTARIVFLHRIRALDYAAHAVSADAVGVVPCRDALSRRRNPGPRLSRRYPRSTLRAVLGLPTLPNA